jgi:hypothetical protein
MKKLTSAAFLSLFVALTGCAFDTPDTELPAFELADEVTGSVGTEAERPVLPPFALSDDVVDELGHAPQHPPFESPNPHTCMPGVFVGCSGDDAVFCGDDGRSLEKEVCENGCGAAACIDSDRNPHGTAPSVLSPN